MRIPKATKRRNGQFMMTTSVEFHIGQCEVVTVIGSMLTASALGYLEGPITRTTVFNALREELMNRGYNMAYMSDDISNDTNDEAVELAVELFPELYKDDPSMKQYDTAFLSTTR